MVTKEFFQDYSLYDFINWLVSRCVDDSINNIKLGKPFKVIIINKIDLDGEYSYYHLGRINSIGELYHIFREYYINCNPTYPFYMDDNTKLYIYTKEDQLLNSTNPDFKNLIEFLNSIKI